MDNWTTYVFSGNTDCLNEVKQKCGDNVITSNDAALLQPLSGGKAHGFIRGMKTA